MFVIGRSLLDLGYVDTMEDVLEKVDAISADDIMQVANEIFAPEKLSYLTYVPQ